MKGGGGINYLLIRREGLGEVVFGVVTGWGNIKIDTIKINMIYRISLK